MTLDNDVALEHYGVKGMKWGQRRAQKRESRQAFKAEKKAYKQNVRKERDEFYDKKATSVVATAAKHPKSLISVYGYHDMSTVPSQMIMTGEQFVTGLSSGAVFNIKYTDVYATMNQKTKRYELNENFNAQYKKPPKPTKKG